MNRYLAVVLLLASCGGSTEPKTRCVERIDSGSEQVFAPAWCEHHDCPVYCESDAGAE